MSLVRRAGRLALTVALPVLLVGWFISVPAAPHVGAWDPGTFSAADESLLFSLTNQARASAGLAPLRNDGQLHSLAEWRAQDMSVRNYFSHEIPPEGYLVFHYMDLRGISYVLAGENIGWNNAPDGESTPMVQDMFMNSPSHRGNILSPRWDAMGIGAYKGTDGVVEYCVLFKQSGAVATPTPEPTPAPTPRPTVHPAATPRPTARPPRETPVPTTAATPPTTAATPPPTPAPTPTPTAEPTPTPTPEPTPTATPEPTPIPTAEPTETPTAAPPATAGAPSQRIVDDAPSPGFLESVIGGMLSLLGTP